MRKLYIAALIVLFAVGALVAVFIFRPVEISYRDSFTITSGGEKTLIFNIMKSGSWLSFQKVEITFGSIQDGQPVTLNTFKIGEIKTFASDSLLGENLVISSELISSPYTYPGKYELYAAIKTGESELTTIPFSVHIRESGEDIVQTVDGPSYRANVGFSGDPLSRPVPEKVVSLNFPGAMLTYRDQIEMEQNGFRPIIVTIDAFATQLMNRQFVFTPEIMENGNTRPISGSDPELVFDVLESYTFPAIGRAVYVLGLSRPDIVSGESLDLSIKVETEHEGEVGRLPVSIRVYDSSDDVINNQPGIESYSGGFTQSARIFVFSDR